VGRAAAVSACAAIDNAESDGDWRGLWERGAFGWASLFTALVRCGSKERREELLSSAVHAAGIVGILRFDQDDTAHYLGLLFVIPRLDPHPHCKSGCGRSIVLAVEDFPTSRAREKWGTWKFPFGPVVTDASTRSFDCAAAALRLPPLRSG